MLASHSLDGPAKNFPFNTSGDSHSEALVESSQTFERCRRLHVEHLNGGQSKSFPGFLLRLSGGGSLDSGNLGKFLDRLGLQDVIQCDNEALLSRSGYHGHSGNTVTAWMNLLV